MIFKTKFPVTCIGSLPHTDEKEACSLILSKFKEIPFWPQLPKKSFLENMYVQFSEHLPGVKVDIKNRTIYVDIKKGEEDIENVFKEYLDSNIDFFGMSKEYASGFFEFLDKAKSADKKGWQFVKGHITGPVSFGLTVLDENKKALFYNTTYKELLFKFLSMKAAWQVRRLKTIFDKVIMFIDEPYLVSIGSSFISLKEEEVAEGLNEIIRAIHNEGALSGLHCCGNTNWGLLLKTSLDIVNFDAYNFIKTIGLYKADLENFLKSSKTIAFGLVPSQSALLDTIDSRGLADIFKGALDELSGKGIKKKLILENSMLTPSCGLGGESADGVDKIFSALFKTKEELIKLYNSKE